MTFAGVARLVSALLATNHLAVNARLVECHTVDVLIDLFFRDHIERTRANSPKPMGRFLKKGAMLYAIWQYRLVYQDRLADVLGGR